MIYVIILSKTGHQRKAQYRIRGVRWTNFTQQLVVTHNNIALLELASVIRISMPITLNDARFI